MSAPFANCKYRMCDLPGQCRDEGHCHHPASGERGADSRPVAICPREVKRDSDFSVTLVFASCRLASEFERQMIANLKE